MLLTLVQFVLHLVLLEQSELSFRGRPSTERQEEAKHIDC